MGDDCGSDLPDGLLYVQTVDKQGNIQAIKGKPKSGVNFWTLEHLKNGNKGMIYLMMTSNVMALQTYQPIFARTLLLMMILCHLRKGVYSKQQVMIWVIKSNHHQRFKNVVLMIKDLGLWLCLNKT